MSAGAPGSKLIQLACCFLRDVQALCVGIERFDGWSFCLLAFRAGVNGKGLYFI